MSHSLLKYLQSCKSQETEIARHVHLLPPVMCHVSHVMCHILHGACHFLPFFTFFLDKVVKLVGGRSVINGATLSSQEYRDLIKPI